MAKCELQTEPRDSQCIELAEQKRNMEELNELQSVVQRLKETEEGFHSQRAEAAAEVRKLSKHNADFRQKLAILGAIPPLVSLLDSDDSDSLISALYALLNLGIGNEANKSTIVKAGAVQKMSSLIKSDLPPAATDAIIANFLALSALDTNKPIIGASSGVIPFLLNVFQNTNFLPPQSKTDALRALYNLSISPLNGSALVAAGIIPCLLKTIAELTEFTERSLAVLSNLAGASPEGRRAVKSATGLLPILIEVLKWSDFPKCQENAVYVIMLMAHKSHGGELEAMVAAGVSSELLELTLVGSAVAQKRAARILEIFREGKGRKAVVSAPVGGAQAKCAVAEEKEEEGVSEERRAVRRLVKESLESNMRRIARRANFSVEFGAKERCREISGSSSCKSLALW